jgi:hypothetical protein
MYGLQQHSIWLTTTSCLAYNNILSGLQQHPVWLTTTSCLAYNNILSGLQQHHVWLTTTSCLAYNNILSGLRQANFISSFTIQSYGRQLNLTNGTTALGVYSVIKSRFIADWTVE